MIEANSNNAVDHSPSTGPSETTRRPLRFGVMHDGGPLAAWQARCVEALTESGLASLCLAITNDRPPSRDGFRRLRKFRWNNLFFELYSRAFGRCSATTPSGNPNLLSDIPEIRCRVERRGRFSEHFSESDLETIASYDLDFVLRFGFGIIRGRIHEIPRYGVWSFHHDDERVFRGVPAAFWSIYHGHPESGLILQRLTDKLDGGIILRRRNLPTIDTSYFRNREQVFLAGTGLPVEVARDVVAGRLEDVCGTPSPTDAPIYFRPTNLEMIRFAATLARNRLRRRRNVARRETGQHAATSMTVRSSGRER